MHALQSPTGEPSEVQPTAGRRPVPAEILTHGIVRAPGRLRWALGLDGVIVLAAGALTGLLVRELGGSPVSAGAAGAVLAVACIATMCMTFTRLGRTPGPLLLGLPTVDGESTLPSGAASLVRGHVLAADPRHGRDPLQIVPTETVRLAGQGGHWDPRQPVMGGPARLLADARTAVLAVAHPD